MWDRRVEGTLQEWRLQDERRACDHGHGTCKGANVGACQPAL